MKSQIQFWCAVGIIKQLAFRDDGSTFEIEVEKPVGEQHIVYQEVLMCRQSRNTLKNKFNAKKNKTVSQRIDGVKLCEKCEKKFKENENLGWQRWIKAPVPKRETTIQLNPFLHGVNHEK